MSWGPERHLGFVPFVVWRFDICYFAQNPIWRVYLSNRRRKIRIRCGFGDQQRHHQSFGDGAKENESNASGRSCQVLIPKNPWNFVYIQAHFILTRFYFLKNSENSEFFFRKKNHEKNSWNFVYVQAKKCKIPFVLTNFYFYKKIILSFPQKTSKNRETLFTFKLKSAKGEFWMSQPCHYLWIN